MSDSKDRDPRQPADETEYRVGHKKPPLHSQFKPGRSGNPRGRPRKQSGFGEILMREVQRAVPVVLNGKPGKLRNSQILASQIVKAAISKGPAAMKLLVQLIEAQEAREAAAAARLKKEGPPFSWSEEQEKLFRRLEARNYDKEDE